MPTSLTSLGPAFKSPLVPRTSTRHAGVAQLVRAPACHAGGRGFEPRLSRHFWQHLHTLASKPFPRFDSSAARDSTPTSLFRSSPRAPTPPARPRGVNQTHHGCLVGQVGLLKFPAVVDRISHLGCQSGWIDLAGHGSIAPERRRSAMVRSSPGKASARMTRKSLLRMSLRKGRPRRVRRIGSFDPSLTLRSDK